MMRYIPVLIYILLDLLILSLLLVLSGIIDNALVPFLHNNSVSDDIMYSIIYFPLIYIIIFIYRGLYTKRLTLDNQLKILLSSMLLSTLIGIVLLFFNKSWDVARLVLLIYLGLSIFIFPVIKALYTLFLVKFPLFQKKLLVLGAGEASNLVLGIINNNPVMGYKVIGILDDDVTKHKSLVQGHKVLGSISKIRRFNLNNADVIIAIPTLNRHQTLTLLSICQKKADNVKFMPDLSGIPVNLVTIEELFDGATVLLNIKNNLKSKVNLFVKRTFDIIISILMLPFILLLLFILSIAIILESKGNPIFTGARLGKDGKLFKCYKFRSMFLNGDDMLEDYLKNNPDAKVEWETYKKLKGFDPRVTRVGKLMRKTSLDELPQIINVLLGDMSLVGPRPYLEREQIDMGRSYYIISEVTPGITGLWQVSGRNSVSFQKRLDLDEYYVRNWSLWLDIMILIKTFKVVLLRKDAY